MCARRIQSNRVGLATLPTGAITTAYRAVVEIECGVCGQPIQPGEMFSRHAAHKGAVSVQAVCTRCRPLRLSTVGEGL